jgi:hypothetical protein
MMRANHLVSHTRTFGFTLLARFPFGATACRTGSNRRASLGLPTLPREKMSTGVEYCPIYTCQHPITSALIKSDHQGSHPQPTCVARTGSSEGSKSNISRQRTSRGCQAEAPHQVSGHPAKVIEEPPSTAILGQDAQKESRKPGKTDTKDSEKERGREKGDREEVEGGPSSPTQAPDKS